MAEYDSQKAICRAVMLEMFGPASAAKVDLMSESDCIRLCQEKVKTLLKEDGVARFDTLFRECMGQSVGASEEAASKKEQCKQIMLELFGPASASRVDSMSEDECVKLCRDKVCVLLGDKVAEQFDRL